MLHKQISIILDIHARLLFLSCPTLRYNLSQQLFLSIQIFVFFKKKKKGNVPVAKQSCFDSQSIEN